MFDIEIDLTEVQAAWAKGCDELGEDLKVATGIAAQDGVARAVSVHPYTDRTGQLTGTATVRVSGDGSKMVWPKQYASYVDQGTDRAQAYNFTDSAVDVATQSLEHHANEAAEKLCEKMNRT